MDDRRGRHMARHKRNVSAVPARGGWRYDSTDQAHYGAGAVVTFDPTIWRWVVWDVRHSGDPDPQPEFITWTASQAMEAWDMYVDELLSTDESEDTP